MRVLVLLIIISSIMLVWNDGLAKKLKQSKIFTYSFVIFCIVIIGTVLFIN